MDVSASVMKDELGKFSQPLLVLSYEQFQKLNRQVEDSKVQHLTPRLSNAGEGLSVHFAVGEGTRAVIKP